MKKNTWMKTSLDRLEDIEGLRISYLLPGLAVIIVICIIFAIGAMFLPWVQTSKGFGEITSLIPEERPQQIISPLNGRITKWYVRDGSIVKAGEKIAEIVDLDQRLLSRYQEETDALKLRLDAASETTNLTLRNYTRQKNLYQEGLTSRREFEAAAINYQKAIADEKYYKSQLLKAQSSLSKQQNQIVSAKRDGIIINTISGIENKIVKPGEVIANFVPSKISNLAVQIYINGNDIPLVYPGRKVRLVFEGWPAIQFSGWPSVSIGTFGGIVKVVDYVASPNGYFRVMVVPDPSDKPWPAIRFLKMGARAQGYIQLNRVSLGYELWRQLNGFPLAINTINNSNEKNRNQFIPEKNEENKDDKDK